MSPMHRELLQDSSADHDDLNKENHPSAAKPISWVGPDTGTEHSRDVFEG